MAESKGIDHRLITTTPLYFPPEDGLTVTNIAADNSVYYKTSDDVDVGDTELTAGSSTTPTVGTWFVAAAGASSRIKLDYTVRGDYDQQLSEIQASYRTIVSPLSIAFPDTLAAATYVAVPNTAAGTLASAIAAAQGVFYLNPADYAVTGKTTQYRVKADAFTNATTVGTFTATWGLYPVSATAGGTDSSTVTTGTVTAGSTVAFVDPATSTRFTGNSGAFTAPAAGYYCLGCVSSASPGANGYLTTNASLQVKNA